MTKPNQRISAATDGKAGKPATYRDIADKVGVSIATVSFALGSNPRKVSAALREKILRVARAMGYSPNPGLRAWQMQIRTRREVVIRESLGWINDHPDRDWWNPCPFEQDFRESAIQRASELGYRMDDIWLPGSAENPPEVYVQKCLSVLRARGITGVMLPHLDYPVCAEVDWPGCAVVVIGKPDRMGQYLHQTRQHPEIRQPQVHHEVNPDFFYNATLAYRSLMDAGYQRIGLVTSLNHDMSSDQLISSAVENEMRQLPPDRRVPILRHRLQFHLEELGPWIQKNKPDAILAVQSEVKPELDRLKIRVPQDIGLAHMNIKFDVPHWSGINRCSRVIGAAAVDLLTSCLQRNETGLPKQAKEVLIKGVWVADQTTRRSSQAHARIEDIPAATAHFRQPTCREIAQRAGVSAATVSFALNRRESKCSEATGERIRRLAEEMGYRPNPLLSTWQAEIRARRKHPVRTALAWINDRPEPDFWEKTVVEHDLWIGAQDRADQLGYRIDPIGLTQPRDRSPEDLVKSCHAMLRARGISGVILPHLLHRAPAEVEWPNCAVVIMGKPNRMSPSLHVASNHPITQHPEIYHETNPDYFFNATLAYRKLTAAGYERIGLAISIYHDMESDQLLSSAMENEIRQSPQSRQVPVLRYDSPFLSAELAPWIRKHRPDVVLAVQFEAKQEIEKMGLRIPEDIGLAHMDVKEDVADWSGISRNSRVVGAAAIDLLTSSLQRNETGVPAHPKEILIKGSWVQGKTTRPEPPHR
ncbi:MAG: LacI family DNA-binding transcriptional regulator [Kiritimatiellia bacterium]|nr:LacI family DNA-binding transcriptional regulator [Kiritimatiellia bacterium]